MDQPIDSLTRATSDTKGRRFGVLTISSKDIFEECPPLRTPLQKGLSQQIPARIPNACQFSSPDPWFPKSARISASPCALLIALNLICSDWGCCGKWDVKQSLVERLAQVWVLQRVASFDTEILRCQKHGRGRGRGRGRGPCIFRVSCIVNRESWNRGIVYRVFRVFRDVLTERGEKKASSRVKIHG
ncbi:hypothetical protein GX48_01060 [Paracoccidioides brasiliensis]|nr:hypothetical protein GX48_01060 [Paracoccidioides brasiliensis]